jgi:septum site-determining protein MinD
MVAKTIGIVSIKGGVGKTSVSASLAADLANNHRKRVLLVDANYSAPNLGLHMDIVEPVKTIHDVLAGKAQLAHAVHTRYGVDVVPGSYTCEKRLNLLKLRGKLDSVKRKYDFIVLDSSPSLNDEILSTIVASDNLFVITTPDYPTLSCSLRAAKLAKQRGKPISGIIINKVRDPKYEINLNEIEKAVGIPVVAKIPDDAKHGRALFTRIPMPIYDGKSKFSREISHLGLAITGGKEKVSFMRKLFGLGFRKEEVNRQVLKDSFYKSIFDV